MESTLYGPTMPGCVTNMRSAIPLKKAEFPSPGWKEMLIAPGLRMRFHGYLLLPYSSILGLVHVSMYRSCACFHSPPEFIHASALLCLENTFHWLHCLWLLQSFQPTFCIDPAPPGKELLCASHLSHKTLFSAQWTAVYFCGKIINVICNVYLYFQRLYSQQGSSGQLYIMGNTREHRKVLKSLSLHQNGFGLLAHFCHVKGWGTEEHAPSARPLAVGKGMEGHDRHAEVSFTDMSHIVWAYFC